ncbi:hypothetical protein ES703_71265 [subsurface metagenome]
MQVGHHGAVTSIRMDLPAVWEAANAAASNGCPELVVYEVDFDSAKDVLRKLRVQNQSTLIVFRGSNEMGRSTGDTNAKSIGALVAKAF